MLKRVVHPGVILKDELEEFGVTPAAAFARQINVPVNRVGQIIAGKRSVTSDTALRFGHWFGVDPQFWLNLQMQYDLVLADRRMGAEIRRLPTRGDPTMKTTPPVAIVRVRNCCPASLRGSFTRNPRSAASSTRSA